MIKKMLFKRKTKYEALGFVEALVAIMVVGISSVVLMQIAVNTMQNTIQNEVIDYMTQHALEGSEIAQEIANKEKSTGIDSFPDQENWGTCFTFIQQGSEYGFMKASENVYLSLSEDQRDTFKDIAVLTEEDSLFRIVCLDENIDENPAFVVARVVVGQRNSEGTITRANLVKDYTYFTVIKL